LSKKCGVCVHEGVCVCVYVCVCVCVCDRVRHAVKCSRGRTLCIRNVCVYVCVF